MIPNPESTSNGSPSCQAKSYPTETGRPHTETDRPHSLPTLIASYHPSRQNTNTGRLTKPMFDEVFTLAREIVDRQGRRMT
jgi:uracil-DNA glycosylase